VILISDIKNFHNSFYFKIMKRISLVLALFFALTLLSSAQTSEEDSVRSTFDRYKTCILNGGGDGAANLVDSLTINYYRDMLYLAKNADSVKVETLAVSDKIMVFSLRHRIASEDLLSFDGRSLFNYTVKTGMVAKNSVINNSIGEVKIDGNVATGKFLVNNQVSPFDLQFYKEAGQWKVNLTSLLPVSNAAVKKMMSDFDQPEDQVIFSLLEKLTGRRPGPEIWQPVK
jgi:hypothetical protein